MHFQAIFYLWLENNRAIRVPSSSLPIFYCIFNNGCFGRYYYDDATPAPDPPLHLYIYEVKIFLRHWKFTLYYQEFKST